jgi:hypothetical protein
MIYLNLANGILAMQYFSRKIFLHVGKELLYSILELFRYNGVSATPNLTVYVIPSSSVMEGIFCTLMRLYRC